ncbi:MAG: tetratricopeptide repeat protein, partial [Bacteroidales bacterium]
FALFNKGNLLCNLDRHAEAIPVYLEYLDNEPESFEAMTYLAECYERINNLPLAKKYYHDAIELAPEFADPWFGLGVIELNSGNPDDSLIYFRKAVRLDDENPEFWYLLGKAHYVKSEIKSSLSCFREALKLDIYYDDVWIDLGRMLLKENLTGKAIHYLEHAYKVTGDVPGINYILASLYLNAGAMDKAFRHISLAIEIDRDIFSDYSELFPPGLLSKKIAKLLKSNDLI